MSTTEPAWNRLASDPSQQKTIPYTTHHDTPKQGLVPLSNMRRIKQLQGADNVKKRTTPKTSVAKPPGIKNGSLKCCTENQPQKHWQQEDAFGRDQGHVQKSIGTTNLRGPESKVPPEHAKPEPDHAASKVTSSGTVHQTKDCANTPKAHVETTQLYGLRTPVCANCQKPKRERPQYHEEQQG